MSNKKTVILNQVKFIASLLFVYIIIFQFILPVNKFLPKPSLFAESFLYIWKDYQLLIAIGYTTSLIYSSLIVSYLVIYLLRGVLIKFLNDFQHVINTLRLFRYVSLFMMLVLFSYWFPASIFAEYVFVVLLTVLFFVGEMLKSMNKVKSEYIIIAKNLGMSQRKIYKEVYWKELQPKLFDGMNHLHFYLWTVVLVYEFVGDAHGLGEAIRNALAFNDYTALIYFVLITTLVMWLFASLLNLINKKLNHWNQ